LRNGKNTMFASVRKGQQYGPRLPGNRYTTLSWSGDPACKGCMYHSPHTHTCDYILIERRPRTDICPSEKPGTDGKHCTVKTKGKRPKPKGYDGTEFVY